MVTHGPVDTQFTEYRVFRGSFHSCGEDFHATTVSDGHHRLKVEAVIFMGVDIVDEAVVDTQGLKPQISQVTERYASHPEAVDQYRNTESPQRPDQ